MEKGFLIDPPRFEEEEIEIVSHLLRLFLLNEFAYRIEVRLLYSLKRLMNLYLHFHFHFFKSGNSFEFIQGSACCK